MRIISGQLRGRRLAAVHGRQTRPTADRVRESLFNILDTVPMQAAVLDLFAGTGALGLEALSRGARQAVFVDHAAQALAVLQKNIDHCGMRDRTRVIRWDIVRNLNCLQPYFQFFNLVFMDPPYGQQMICPALAHVLACGCMAPGALFVIETASSDTLDDMPTGMLCNDVRTYGATKLWFLSNIGVKD